MQHRRQEMASKVEELRKDVCHRLESGASVFQPEKIVDALIAAVRQEDSDHTTKKAQKKQ
jgi:hypothetical protein